MKSMEQYLIICTDNTKEVIGKNYFYFDKISFRVLLYNKSDDVN